MLGIMWLKRLSVGKAFGARSPVATLSPTLVLDVQLPAGAIWTLPMLANEQAIYPLQGNGAVAGGQPVGHRFIWWNFVSNRKERIGQAKVAWTYSDANVGMGQVPGETEQIELRMR